MEIIGKGLGNGSKGLATAAELVGAGAGGFGVEEEGGVKSDGVRVLETAPGPSCRLSNLIWVEGCYWLTKGVHVRWVVLGKGGLETCI